MKLRDDHPLAGGSLTPAVIAASALALTACGSGSTGGAAPSAAPTGSRRR